MNRRPVSATNTTGNCKPLERWMVITVTQPGLAPPGVVSCPVEPASAAASMARTNAESFIKLHFNIICETCILF